MIAEYDLKFLAYRSLAHWLRKGAQGDCCLEGCEETATHTFILYPSRDEYPLCAEHAAATPHGFGALAPSLEFLINQGAPGLTIPTIPAGDHHSWISTPDLPAGWRRGVTFVRHSSKRGEVWIEASEASPYSTVQFSLPPGTALLLLDVLKAIEPELKAMAEEDHKILTAYHNQAEARARRADAGGWEPIEE